MLKMVQNIPPEIIEELVKKAQKGNEKHFAEIFDYFFPKIFRHISFRVHSENAEDLTSDVFLKVVKNIKKYKSTPKATFSSWVFRIAHNTIIDHYRKEKELLGIDNEDQNFFAELPDEKTPLPNEQTNQTLDFKKMHQLLQCLPADQRTILKLKYLEGFTNPEIAIITNKTEGNIRIIQLRALRKIRKQWDE